MKKLISYVLVFVLGFGACAFILNHYGYLPGTGGGTDNASIITELTKKPAKPVVRKGQNPIADAAAIVGPAVVNIDVAAERSVPNPLGRMFGIPLPAEKQVLSGQGSGVIIDKTGLVVTNNHVIAGAQDIKVRLMDGRKFKAKVLARDPRADLAVVKLTENAKDLPVAKLGNSDGIRVGDWAIAIGNPLGFGNTVTVGVISATKRQNLPVGPGKYIEEAIQTDAAINRGNSGGALINANGEVIGINTAIYSTEPGQGSIGIGFAIPSNYARDTVKRLIERGSAVYPFLGIFLADLEGDMKTWYKQQGFKEKGAVITGIQQGTPAAKAGLQQGDIIVKLDNKKIDNAEQITKLIRDRKVGQVVRITVWRNGATVMVMAKLAEAPDVIE